MMQWLYKRFKSTLRQGPLGDRDGFTLIEMLMVLMILTVGILPIAVIQNRAKRQVTEASQFTKAIVVAQDKLESMKGLGFGSVQADRGMVGNIRWVGTVTNVSFGLDQIEVTASWDASNPAESITIADLVSLR